jgi:8-oxo-dGTP pyrophosphatase MutT (NUDIX family)
MASASSRISPPVSEPARDAVRDAATVVLLRRGAKWPQVLMGQRGASAAFMPDKFVFPGGAVDPDDIGLSQIVPEAPDAERLALEAEPAVARALPFTAIRELWEETGLRLGRPDPAAGMRAEASPFCWRGFFASGALPRPEALRFIFRAVTPPGRSRRFDARFFLADAENVLGNLADFTGADHELRDLQWIDLAAARDLPLPFITEVVLSEIAALIDPAGPPRPVPFFLHDASGSHFRLL